MEITIRVSDELVEAARRKGLSAEALAEELLREHLKQRDASSAFVNGASVDNWLDKIAQFSERIPPLPATITRDWLYQDHD